MSQDRSKPKILNTKIPAYDHIYRDISDLILSAKSLLTRSINTLMTITYWEIGRKIVEHEQEGHQRAKYGAQLMEKLALDLTNQFGRGFGIDNLELMRLFYLNYPIPVVSDMAIKKLGRKSLFKKSESLIRIFNTGELQKLFPLSWTHYVRLIRRCNSKEEREFYGTEALRGGWPVRMLERQIATQFYQRTLLSKNKAALLKKEGIASTAEKPSPEEAIKDPYVLEFLNLKDEYSETDLEDALINKLEDFLLELGDDFAFVGRQRRLRIGDEWYRVDLLFFHRRLRCLIIIDLKLGKFTHADAGQMHLYLNYASEHWVKEGENPPVGLILCAQKDHTLARYALDALPNKVLATEYKLALPDEARLVEELSKVREMIEANYERK